MEYFTGFFDFGARFESWQTIAKDSRLELSTGPGLQAVLDGSFGGIVSGRTILSFRGLAYLGLSDFTLCLTDVYTHLPQTSRCKQSTCERSLAGNRIKASPPLSRIQSAVIVAERLLKRILTPRT